MNKIGLNVVILGCSTGCLPYFDDLELFESLKNIDVSVFELLVYRRFKDLNIIEDMAKNADRPFYSVHAAKALGDMFFTEASQEFQSYKSRYETNLRLATSIGAKVILLHGWNYTPKKLDPRKLVANWNTLRDLTQTAKLELSIELVPITSRSFARSLFAAIDEDLDHSISITFDTESAAWSGVTSEILERVNRIKNVHVKDFDGHPILPNGRRRYLAPGKGQIDFKSIFQQLKNAKYDRPIILETPHRTITELNESLRYLRTLLDDK